jgi:hypothetical protein
MKLKVLPLIAAALLCMGSIATAGQQTGQQADKEKGSNLSDEKGTVSAQAQAVDARNLAERLAAYGRAQKAPLSLAAAAQILADVPVQDQQQQKTDEAGTAVPSVAGETFPDAAALFGEAVALAKEQQNPALADIIDKQAKAAGQTKGRLGGAARHVDSVKAAENDVYRLTFRGGERAVVTAQSRYGEDIDILVRDENSVEICKDYGSDGIPVCAWTPKWTGPFYVTIKNRTRGPVRYALTTN